MVGTFDNLATLVNDLANATLSVISTVFTGGNATIILTAVVIIALVMIFMRIPDKLMSKYFRKY